MIDGLQRISTILEFMGLLKSPNGKLLPPSVLEATKYLPSLHNAVWEKTDKITGLSEGDQVPLDKSLQLSIRRARLSVEILKRPSENKTKFDLFQRLNAGGTQANPQELRNCIIIMVSHKYYTAVKEQAENELFQDISGLREEHVQRQRHMEYASRFLVHALVPYDGKLDVEEYIDEGIVRLAENADTKGVKHLFEGTFSLLAAAGGEDVLRRNDGGKPVGRVTLGAFEAIAVGVAKNLDGILELPDPAAFVKKKVLAFWGRPELETFSSPGLRGTIRIQRTVPFGQQWFKP